MNDTDVIDITIHFSEKEFDRLCDVLPVSTPEEMERLLLQIICTMTDAPWRPVQK